MKLFVNLHPQILIPEQMKFTARQIAEMLQGQVDGNPDATVWSLARIEEGAPGCISFLANPKYTPFVYSTASSIVIVNQQFIPEKTVSATLIRVVDAYIAFGKLLELYNQIKLNKTGISEKSSVAETASIGAKVYIGDFASIGDHVVIGDNVKIYPHVYLGDNVRIGDNSILFSGVKVYSDNVIGKSCTLHSGVVIGADGFGFAPQSDQAYSKLPQIGNVVIEDQVEIGANTTIDRATLGSTIIRKGVKLDNLIQIAHNVQVGENTVIAAQTGVSGSTHIGANCMIGGQAGVVGHIQIADGVKIAAQSGIGNTVSQPGAILQGSPAFDLGKYQRSYVVYRKLPDLARQIAELEKRVKELENS